MRLLVPREAERYPPVIREVIAAGWECHLEAAEGSEATVRARDYLLCPRCAAPEEVPRRSGGRPPSVLGLHLKSDGPEKFGGWTPGPLETVDIDEAQWGDEDIASWLGPQATVFYRALKQGLDFLEVYAGTARASDAVLAKGGLALFLGLDHRQDFRNARDRSLGKALLHRTAPRHYWGSFPCTPFCAWIRLAILRNCDMTLRLKEGRLHLKYALELAALQVEAGRHAHLENPLTSMAWREPIALKALALPVWLRARLDQCQTGLSSPAGGLHLKPNLIRTTDPAMRDALSLTCSRDHPHDPVAGAATALSAMYSPHLADLIATVVLHGGGEGASFSRTPPPAHARVGGGTAASFSPGSRSTWHEGLKGPELRGPLSSPLSEETEKACKVYLTFVKEAPYGKDAFRFEGLHSSFFEGLVADNLLEKARENAVWGVSANYEGGTGQRVQCGPHPSLREHLEEAAQQIWKDASRGRVLLYALTKGAPSWTGWSQLQWRESPRCSRTGLFPPREG